MNTVMGKIGIILSVAIPVAIVVTLIAMYNKKFYVRKNRSVLNSIQY